MWTINTPDQLPPQMRQARGYHYLNNSYASLWLKALTVDHGLLEAHEEIHGKKAYYQESFGIDYIARLSNPQFGTSSLFFDGTADLSQVQLHYSEQHCWQEFERALEGLRSAPRGAIALLNAQGRWHIRIHAGDGYISECRTMRCTGPKPSVHEIQDCLVTYEGYLAGCQAKAEKIILRNFALLRALKLQPGQMLSDVKLQRGGQVRGLNLRIQAISPSGYLSLTDPSPAGNKTRFNATVAASKIYDY